MRAKIAGDIADAQSLPYRALVRKAFRRKGRLEGFAKRASGTRRCLRSWTVSRILLGEQQVAARLGEIRLDTRRLSVGCNGLCDVALIEQRRSAVVQGLGVVRPDRQSPVIAGDSLRIASEVRKSVPAVEQRLSIGWRERQSLLETRERFKRLAQSKQRPTAVVVRFRVSGTDRKRLIKTCERLLDALQLRQRGAPTVQRFGVARRQRQRAVVARVRVLIARQFEQDVAAIAPGFDVMGRKRERLVSGVDRFVEFAERLEYDRETGPSGRVSRINRHRLGDQRPRLDRGALLMAQDAQQVERRRVVRLGRLVVSAFR